MNNISNNININAEIIIVIIIMKIIILILQIIIMKMLASEIEIKKINALVLTKHPQCTYWNVMLWEIENILMLNWTWADISEEQGNLPITDDKEQRHC